MEKFETYHFETYQKYDLFELEFQKYISPKKIKNLDSANYLNFHFYKILDIKSGKTYCLSTPENAWRGFFLEESKAKHYIENLRKTDQKKRIGCGVILTILISIALIFIILKN